jgi:transposase-like protein
MDSRRMKRVLALVDALTTPQRRELLQRLQAAPPSERVLQMVESRLDGLRQCPHCQCARLVRNGHADGLQRYKCRGCSRTFNALSATALARLRLKDKWLQQADVLCQGLIVRLAAKQLQVAPSTAFRWRHRFLQLAQQAKPESLSGVVEVDETYQLRSFKGQAVLGRAARRRGGKASTRGLSKEHVPMLVARDRSGATTDFVLPAPSIAEVLAVLRPVVAADAILCTDGSPMLASVAKGLQVAHEALNLKRGIRVRGPWHIQNVNAYHGRFKEWLSRFHGVASSYLPSYLGWFRAIDRFRHLPANPSRMLALNLGI